MLSLSQLGEILLLIFFRGEEKNFTSLGIMRSAKTRRAFCTVASAALLATSSQTGVMGEPTTSSSFSSVSDESSLCDESAVASKDPFEKIISAVLGRCRVRRRSVVDNKRWCIDE